jgi:hypothetical protein
MAVNKAVGDNARKGAVKKRTQLKNSLRADVFRFTPRPDMAGSRCLVRFVTATEISCSSGSTTYSQPTSA